ncbi:glycosyltransferase family 1 protein [Candidatus Microgenomates bacterium]|nr:MAG: glycosyltransferase family 1 protein [Candidatus Microgenomates bacterium]
MRIAIDISQSVYSTGVAVYTREFTRALVTHFPNNEYVLYGGSLRKQAELREYIDSLPNNSCIIPVVTGISPSIANVLWNKTRAFSIDPLIGKCDILHTSDWVEPKSKSKKVTTIHDFAPIKFASDTHPKIADVHKRKLELVKQESAGVIVPSESTKKDAIDFGVKKELLHVIPEAPQKIYKKTSKNDVLEVTNKYRITGPYVLAIGTAKRKNLTRTISAFKQIKNSTDMATLVVVGENNSEYQQEDALFLGFVPDSDLSKIMSGAEMLIYASLYEGFGLPILEAFSVGCPVVTSNVSSMPEVSGKAAVLVNPENVNSISKGITRTLKERDKLIEKGYIELKKYSWKNNASKTMDLYKYITQQ